MRLWRRSEKVVDPVGWDAQHQRIHDVGFVAGALMHYSTCWCRTPCACHAALPPQEAQRD